MCVRAHSLLLLDHTAKMCILMLLSAPAVAVLPHSRSGQWKRAGLLVAVRVVPAELRGENRHSGNIFVSYGVRAFTCFYSLFLDYLFRGGNLEVDVFDREGEKTHARLLTTAPACQQLGNERENRSIYFTHVQKYLKPFKQSLFINVYLTVSRTSTVASLKRENSHRTRANTVGAHL